MKSIKNQKGFTLIELLIVIVIIGILAVAFLPTLLGAPEKARDTKRVADLQKIQKVLIEGNLSGKAYPTSAVCIGTGTSFDSYIPALGGALPKDSRTFSAAGVTNCGAYVYVPKPGNYAFGLYTKLENKANGNINCTGTNSIATLSAAGTDFCYAILTQ